MNHFSFLKSFHFLMVMSHFCNLGVLSLIFFSEKVESMSRELMSRDSDVGLPWWSSGWDSVLPLQGAWVPSLVGELGSCMPHGTA